MVRPLTTSKHLLFCVTRKLSPPQDFVADPVNPNVDGLLENIKRSCKVVIDENGNGAFPSVITNCVHLLSSQRVRF